MKFTLEVPDKRLNIRSEILDAANLHGSTALEVHTGENAVVLLKEQMTAMELVQAIQSLKDLTSDLLVHLAKACGPCEHVVTSSASLASGPCPKAHSLRCSSSSGQTRSAGLCPDSCMAGCPCTRDNELPQLPDALLERAGIPKGAKLDIFAEGGEICIAAATGPDLRDVPLDLLELFRQTRICLDTLDELLTKGEVVYGG